MDTDAKIAEERSKKFSEQATESIPKFLDKTIPIRITYKLGDEELLLAHSVDSPATNEAK